MLKLPIETENSFVKNCGWICELFSINNTWPGELMKYVGLNEYGQSIYSITYDSSLYDHIIFNASGGQTVNITAGPDGTGYYLTGTRTGIYWDVQSYTYR